MDNYDSMTDGELRRVVAEREGWKQLEWIGDTLIGCAPDNWKQDTGTEPPNWLQSADDALALPSPDGASLYWNDAYEDKYWEAIFPVGDGDIVADHESPGRAWSIAWLRWQDAQEDGE